MEKFLWERGFPIFGGNFYVASLKLDFWPPFCYCKSDFEFLLCFSSFGLYYQWCELERKIIRENTFLS